MNLSINWAWDRTDTWKRDKIEDGLVLYANVYQKLPLQMPGKIFDVQNPKYPNH